MADIVNFRRLKHAAPSRLQGLAGAPQRRGRWSILWLMLFAFAGAAMIGSLLLAALPGRMPGYALSEPQAAVTASFPLCGGGQRITCVVDGDTFWLDGLKYRIADIDTPEISSPQCAAEKTLGDRATRRLAELLNAGAFTLASADRDEDRYGRKLRIVTRDGASLGEMLVAEGLAHRWDGRKHPWC